MIRDDIALARALYRRIESTPELQAFTQNLSITTFRFAPRDLSPGGPEVEDYLNALNREILNRLQAGGEVYVSNAVMEKTFLLRACVVNFRTRLTDIEALPGIVVREGKAADARMRPLTWGKRSGPDAVDRLSI
jgi:glutamate/tyrosine decarboxylase-like PLP-dependent enzyme